MLLLMYIWRVYGLMVILAMTLLLYPFLIVTVIIDSFGAFYFLEKLWGRAIFILLGWYYSITKESKSGLDFSKENYIIVANHTSYMDIFSMILIVPKKLMFIGKRELAKIPIFSTLYRRTNILVDRNSNTSGKKALEEGVKVLNEGFNLCIFPEGGIPKNYSTRLAKFKHGAFSISKQTGKKILPITFLDNKYRYPYSWKRGGIGRCRIFIHETLDPKDFSTEEELKNKAFEIIENKLIECGR